MLDFSNQTPQLMMLAGIVMLGWTLVRRQMKARKRSRQDDRQHRVALKQMGKQQANSMPLADAPVETLRWQAAMFDLQRELKAELETKICVVQSLLNQVDERIARLENLQGGAGVVELPPLPLTATELQRALQLHRDGHPTADIATELKLPVGDGELALATDRSDASRTSPHG